MKTKQYDHITIEELLPLFNNAVKVLKSSDLNDESTLYSANRYDVSFAGCTDYKDHRQDTLDYLISLAKDDMIKSNFPRLMQRIAYKDMKDGKYFNTLVFSGCYGGWFVKMLWK